MTIRNAKRALIVVDVQNDFADPRGSLYVRGASNAILNVNREIRNAVDAGHLVVYTQDWHPESTPHFEKDGGIWPVHCVAETWGAALHPDLTIAPDGAYIRKGVDGEDGYSGFSVRDPQSGAVSATTLKSLLDAEGIAEITVVGIATDYCVKETVLDATRLGLRTTVVADSIAAVNLQPDDGARAIEAMVAAGANVV